jgi:hypothetical protein
MLKLPNLFSNTINQPNSPTVKKILLIVILLHSTTHYALRAQTHQEQALIDSLLTALKESKKNAGTNAPAIKDTATADLLYPIIHSILVR